MVNKINRNDLSETGTDSGFQIGDANPVFCKKFSKHHGIKSEADSGNKGATPPTPLRTTFFASLALNKVYAYLSTARFACQTIRRHFNFGRAGSASEFM